MISFQITWKVPARHLIWEEAEIFHFFHEAINGMLNVLFPQERFTMEAKSCENEKRPVNNSSTWVSRCV